MRRSAFITLSLAAAASRFARADGEMDPAMNASSAELRVLLGPGVVGTLRSGFTFNGRPYRGQASQTADGQVINTVALEEYLYSVIPREMTSSWPAAALQAQAVCARTYVLQRSNPLRGYDVVPSELDQVYGGIAAETPAARAAVDATSGVVLQFSGRFAHVAYSSCCGGHTESSADAWGGVPIPYLSGVVCTTCTDSPYYRWDRELDLSVIADLYAEVLQPVAPLQTLQEGARDASGRARDFLLTGARGVIPVKGPAFRLRVGPRVLPSLLIAKIEGATEAPERVAIEGGGLGHGVGLCQWGARGRALEGAAFSDILHSYFPGTEIEHE